MLWGGAQIINQYLAAGLLDELELHIVPVFLEGGARLFDNLEAPRSSSSRSWRRGAGVTHVKYRMVPA